MLTFLNAFLFNSKRMTKLYMRPWKHKNEMERYNKKKGWKVAETGLEAICSRKETFLIEKNWRRMISMKDNIFVTPNIYVPSRSGCLLFFHSERYCSQNIPFPS